CFALVGAFMALACHAQATDFNIDYDTAVAMRCDAGTFGGAAIVCINLDMPSAYVNPTGAYYFDGTNPLPMPNYDLYLHDKGDCGGGGSFHTVFSWAMRDYVTDLIPVRPGCVQSATTNCMPRGIVPGSFIHLGVSTLGLNVQLSGAFLYNNFETGYDYTWTTNLSGLSGSLRDPCRTGDCTFSVGATRIIASSTDGARIAR